MTTSETEPIEYVVRATIRATHERSRDAARRELARIVAQHGEWDDVTEASIKLDTVDPSIPVDLGAYGAALARLFADEMDRWWDRRQAAEDEAHAGESAPTGRAMGALLGYVVTYEQYDGTTGLDSTRLWATREGAERAGAYQLAGPRGVASVYAEPPAGPDGAR